MEGIKNAYISVEIDDSSLNKLTKDVISVLTQLGVQGTALDRLHISIAYAIGIESKELLEQIVSDIAEGSFEIKGIGFSIIKSEYFKKDLICLKVKSTHDFDYAVEYVAENCELKKFPGGFIAHISLISIDHLNEEDKENLARYLEIINSDFISRTEIDGKSISVFDENRELIIQKYFPS